MNTFCEIKEQNHMPQGDSELWVGFSREKVTSFQWFQGLAIAPKASNNSKSLPVFLVVTPAPMPRRTIQGYLAHKKHTPP
jgi:hypothetical protein